MRVVDDANRRSGGTGRVTDRIVMGAAHYDKVWQPSGKTGPNDPREKSVGGMRKRQPGFGPSHP